MQKVIINRIREFRKAKGLRQTELARELGIFQSEVSDIETGKRRPNVYLAMRIAKVLGKDVSEVFPLDHEEKKQKNNL